MNIKEMSFEDVLQKYEPIIKKQLITLRIYKNLEEFYQIGCIALWQAYEKFDPQKGKFTTYAISFIRGKMLTHLNGENRHEERYIASSGEVFENCMDERKISMLEMEVFLSYITPLTTREKTWATEAIYLQKTSNEIATDYGVSVNTVKSWRKSALKKLRTTFKMNQLT